MIEAYMLFIFMILIRCQTNFCIFSIEPNALAFFSDTQQQYKYYLLIGPQRHEKVLNTIMISKRRLTIRLVLAGTDPV